MDSFKTSYITTKLAEWLACGWIENREEGARTGGEWGGNELINGWVGAVYLCLAL